jgi:hemoglobin
MPEQSLFEALGADIKLRAIIDRFVDRIFDDLMIGYLFRAADRQRVKDKEFEFAAHHLGAPISYTGRPLAEAHRAHSITGGQFMRRLQILKETLAEFEVPEPIREHWLKHTLALQAQITDGALDQCDPGHSNHSGSVPACTPAG